MMQPKKVNIKAKYTYPSKSNKRDQSLSMYAPIKKPGQRSIFFTKLREAVSDTWTLTTPKKGLLTPRTLIGG